MATVVAEGAADVLSKAIAPTLDWTDMKRSEHFIQFYESDSHIVNSVAEYIIHGLQHREVCIIAATDEHLKAIEQIITGFDVDLGLMKRTGRYIPLSADETLNKFMVNGMPDARRFDEVLGPVIKNALSGRLKVRVFGEMVAVLLAAGNSKGCMRLESLWNDLVREQAFSLFCAYPMDHFTGAEGRETMKNVCCSHGRVIPDETYTAISSADERLRMIASLQQRTKQLTAELAELERSIATMAARDNLASVNTQTCGK